MTGLVIQRGDVGVPIEALTPGDERMSKKKEEALARAEPEEKLEPVLTTLDEIRLIAEDNPKAIAAWITSVAKANES